MFGGFGNHAAGLNNNLSSSEYRYLTGPPLALCRQFSRVITNLFTGHGRYQFAPHCWIAFGAWRKWEPEGCAVPVGPLQRREQPAQT